MDGNGRWAKKRGLPRKLGHKEGANALKRIVEYANNIGIEYLIVYAFSTENWKRSKQEVDDLMSLLSDYLKSFDKHFNKDEIRIKVIGRRDKISQQLRESIDNVEKATKGKKGLTFVIALDYGGRQEMVVAVRELAKDVCNNNIQVDDINEDTISRYVYTKDIPDPDIIIRTSGEQRMSNFLMWQGVYSELYFTDVLWPEFTNKHLDDAILEYNKRSRRFGGR